jgi:hypothetical protein
MVMVPDAGTKSLAATLMGCSSLVVALQEILLGKTVRRMIAINLTRAFTLAKMNRTQTQVNLG